jgi:hypothetical protein
LAPRQPASREGARTRRNERCGNGPRERPAISITFGPEICDDATSIEPALRVASADQQRRSIMSISAIRGTTLLMTIGLVSAAWAQDTASPVPSNFSFPAGSEITYQWNYTCRSSKPCSFSCGATNNVIALTLFLGSIPVGGSRSNSVIFYFYSTATVPHNDGFRISGGPASTLSCNVNGMTLDYSGPPVGIPTAQARASDTR